jgi:uncharacterized membrane protein YeaQ/YmgE (transglycosylase-associated protein family)
MGIISVILLGLVCGAIARVLIPGDAFEHMSGPVSWLVSLVLGLLGALLGFWFFTGLLGIGDADKFDWGGILGALIGSVVVVAIASFILNRSRSRNARV